MWQEQNMATMRDFLIWYNNKDVEPMMEAIDKMFAYHRSQNVDMFKNGISVPGLTLKTMFDCTRTTSIVDPVSCFIVTTRKTRP